MTNTPDVVIVGAGPAGLATALEARRHGLDVVVLDRAPGPPRDKPCGEGLMPDARTRLAELGVTLPAGAARPFAGIRYVDGDVVAEGRFPSRYDGPVGGLGVRRTALHGALVERAREQGVEICWGVTVTGVNPEAGVVQASDGAVSGRFLVAADGLQSPLRRRAGLDVSGETAPGRFGMRRHLAAAPWSDCVEVHWIDGAEAYVTPVGEGEVGIALLWTPHRSDPSTDGRRAGFAELLGRFPRLAERLEAVGDDLDAVWSSPLAGCGPLARRARSVVRGRLALVGDAAGYLDAITGEGLAVAFHEAEALGRAMASGDLSSYPGTSRSIRRLPDAMTRLLLAVERRPWLRRRAIRALAADTAVFDRLLAIHARSAPPSSLGIGGAWRLAHGLVAG